MSGKTRLDLGDENFDLYFARQIEKLIPAQKEKLPKDISFKIFRKGSKFDSKSTSRLSFLEKLYVLCTSLNKKWYLVVEDENGLSEEQFLKLRSQFGVRMYGMGAAEENREASGFVLASKELCQCFDYLNRLNLSPAYNYIIKGKNRVSNPATEWTRKMQYIAGVFAFYEANKKTWVASTGVSIPEWLILIYLYDKGEEVPGSPIHKSFYKRAYQSSPTKLKRCFGVLQAKGLIQKTGEGKGAKMSITALGKDTVNTILTKYALDK